MTTPTLVLTAPQMQSLLSMNNAISAVEDSFRAKVAGQTSVTQTFLRFDSYGGDIGSMSAYLKDKETAAVKVIGYNPHNPQKNRLPTISGVVVVTDPRTSIPLAIMDAAYVTSIGTGAVGALAAKLLARRDSRIVGMIGAGVQARTQMIGVDANFDIEKVRVWSRTWGSSRKFAREMKAQLDVGIVSVHEPKKAVMGADIVITVTPSRHPIVANAWISEGTHVNAIGADEPGKQEIDSEITKRACIVVDDREEAVQKSEINLPYRAGIITKDSIYAELGEIVLGKIGRTSDDQVTLYAGAGSPIQDAAVAFEIYKRALRAGAGVKLRFQ